MKLEKNRKRRNDQKKTTWRLNNMLLKKPMSRDFPDGAVVKNLPANAGDTDLIPGLGRFHMLQSN